MRSPSLSKTKTINVNGDIIKMKVSRVTRQANLQGFNVKINECKYFFSVLTFQEAFDKGYVKYIQANR